MAVVDFDVVPSHSTRRRVDDIIWRAEDSNGPRQSINESSVFVSSFPCLLMLWVAQVVQRQCNSMGVMQRLAVVILLDSGSFASFVSQTMVARLSAVSL